MASGERISGAPTARRVVIAANPRAGFRSGQLLIQGVAQGLRERGLTVEIIADIAHLTSRVQEGHADGSLYAVAAAGGDGTAALVVNVLPPSVPLALIPLGTENLFAKYLGIVPNVQAICDSIALGNVVQLDAGKANDRLFLLMLGCGFDAEVVRRLHRERTGHIHHLSYAKPILESIRSYEYPELRVYFQPADASPNSLAAPEAERGLLVGCWAFVVNLPRYAGGLSIVPGADGSDGLLDVCTFKHGNLWNGLMYLGGVWFGQHRSWRDFEAVRTTRVRIETDAPDVPYQVDGDPGGVLPVEVEVLPGRVSVLAPPTWVSAHARSQPLAPPAELGHSRSE